MGGRGEGGGVSGGSFVTANRRGETTECPVSPVEAQIATKQKPFFSGGKIGEDPICLVASA